MQTDELDDLGDRQWRTRRHAITSHIVRDGSSACRSSCSGGQVSARTCSTAAPRRRPGGRGRRESRRNADAFRRLAWGFQTYVVAVFVLPLLYGAWRLVLFNMVIGPVLSAQLTSNPNGFPAIWCLFSIGIDLIVLSPGMRRQVAWQAAWA